MLKLYMTALPILREESQASLQSNYYFLEAENKVKINDFLDSIVIANSVLPNRRSADLSVGRSSVEFSANRTQPIEDLESVVEQDIKQLSVFYSIYFSYNSSNPESLLGESKLLLILGYDKKLLEKEKVIEEGSEPLTPLAFAIKLKNLDAVKLLMRFNVDFEHPSVKKQIKNLLSEEHLLPHQREISKAICNVFLISGTRLDLASNLEVSAGFAGEKKGFLEVQQLFENLKNQQILLNKENAKEVFLNALKEFNSYDSENRVRNQSSIFDLSVGMKIKDQHGIDQDFQVNIIFLKKLLDKAIVKKPICHGCCGLFSRLSSNETIKEFLAKDPETKDELTKFLSNSEVSRQLQDIIRKSISESRPSVANSTRQSHENRLSSDHKFYSRQGLSSAILSRGDIFESLEESPYHASQAGMVSVGDMTIEVPPPNPESPSTNALRAPINRRITN